MALQASYFQLEAWTEMKTMYIHVASCVMSCLPEVERSQVSEKHWLTSCHGEGHECRGEPGFSRMHKFLASRFPLLRPLTLGTSRQGIAKYRPNSQVSHGSYKRTKWPSHAPRLSQIGTLLLTFIDLLKEISVSTLLDVHPAACQQLGLVCKGHYAARASCPPA